eukprot:gnl/TRDRNA2_/TRDRNA2_200877_c0_seq1.p1 gnl/TRDRNA2_/TRDRNA2_200877_c0~~gnl/TRDRNA2_/TRDRNA2_200877_c0_seq1.p1  ORF type:complete len:356 (-),score=62.35 gnl/TRDRNA2_/TRDRNA2_200877_c0_seq1:38-1042(-)
MAAPALRRLAGDGGGGFLLVATEAPAPVVPRGSAMQCELLGRWGSFGWWLQAFLGLVCLASLVGKRFTDKVRRPWKVWFFDTSKQGVQAMMNHLMNIGLSKAFGAWLDADADPCNWYWINLSLDCTAGIAMLLLMLRGLQCIYRMKCVGRPELARSGEYGEPPDRKIWARQLLDWQGLVVIQKCVLAVFVINFRNELAFVAEKLLGWLDSHPKVKLVVVMVVTPLVLNVFALWTADTFLQADPALRSDEARERLVCGVPSIVGQRGSEHASNAEDFSGDEADRIVSFQEWKRRATALGRKTSGHTPLPQIPSQSPTAGGSVEMTTGSSKSYAFA